MNNNVHLENAMLLNRLRRVSRPLSYVVAAGMLALSVHWSSASAAVIGTETVVNAQQAQVERARLSAALEREEVKEALLAAGADPAEVAGRVEALSDAEVQQLAARMDELPAGGDALGVLVFVFLVLLITDLLGFTDVFPFVKKPVRR